jgi:hypothetical protein
MEVHHPRVCDDDDGGGDDCLVSTNRDCVICMYLLVMWRMVMMRSILVALGSTVARRCTPPVLTLSVKHVLVFDSLGLPALL